MNEHIIANIVITKHNFSILSILCAKFPFASNTNALKMIPIIIIGAIIAEWNIVVNTPMTIIPIATNATK